MNGRLSALKSKSHPGRVATISRCPSSDGKFTLRYSEKPVEKVWVESRNGQKLREIQASEDQTITAAGWSPHCNACYVVCSGADDPVPNHRGKNKSTESGLFVFGIRNRKFRLAVRGPVGEPQWSSDGRYIACIMTGSEKPESIPESVQSRVGYLRVYESSSLRQMLSPKKIALDAKFSPDGRYVAFIELVKDEYGEFANFALKVANIRSGGVVSIVVNRREPNYAWAGNGRLAVVTYDKFAVPSLGLVDLATRKSTRLATSHGFASFEPLAYVSSENIVAYKAATSISGEKPEELWAARPGSAPMRLFPRVGGTGYAKR